MSDIFTINNKVQKTLEELFQQHRLVFWYDEKAEMTFLFENLLLEGVEKVVLANNEFSVKHRILVGQPGQKFLLYQPSPKPDEKENWLLDLLLSHYEFHTEASSLYLHELGVPPEFRELIRLHEGFFASEKRINEFKALLEPDETESTFRLKMVSVVCGCDPEWDKVLYVLFAETFKNKADRYKEMQKFGLQEFFWNAIEKRYRYQAVSPTIKDFILQLITDHFQRSFAGGNPVLNKEAFLFVNRWKENIKSREVFAQWSKVFNDELAIETLIASMLPEQLLEADTYPAIEQKIIIALREHIIRGTLPNYQVQQWIEKRRVKFFFADFENIYQALSYSGHLLDEIRNVDLTVRSPRDGFEKYVKNWFLIDRLYRNYIAASEQAEHHNVLKELTIRVEKAYGNSFLLPLGDVWQKAVDGMKCWEVEGVAPQSRFYSRWVEPIAQKENRVFVIISDAFRFETADEFREIILREDRYTAQLSAVLSGIPSYTQMGMAGLLPHHSLTFNDASDTVFADGQSTQGTANRTKILQSHNPASVAIGAEDFLRMKAATEGREFIKPFNVVYIYSNTIDKAGDDKASEHKVFEATRNELEQLLRIVKHINNMNGYNMIVTADHGYIYQHNRLDESDFTDFTPSGEVFKSSRRFVLGKNLYASAAVNKWKGAAAGYGDDTEVLIPKSINRIRIQGSGSRFVHGGTSLQEVVVPVLEINKARKSDIELVDVDIISGSSNITSNTFGVSFYQKQPVGDKILPRQFRAGFYTTSGLLISDVVPVLCNSTDTDSLARERRQTFLFTAEASKFNGQDVSLKLEEPIEGTSQFKVYKSITYRMLIAFGSEFDNF